MKNLILLLAVAAFVFSIMAVTQTLPSPIQVVVNDMAHDFMPGQKVKLTETQRYRLDAATKASFK